MGTGGIDLGRISNREKVWDMRSRRALGSLFGNAESGLRPGSRSSLYIAVKARLFNDITIIYHSPRAPVRPICKCGSEKSEQLSFQCDQLSDGEIC
jgi:hypothetical protein